MCSDEGKKASVKLDEIVILWGHPGVRHPCGQPNVNLRQMPAQVMTNGAKLRKEEGRFEKETHFNRASQKKPY